MAAVPYQWRKALINSSQILIGFIAIKLAPYALPLSLGNWPPDLTLTFFRHLILSALVVTGFAEFRYFYRWLNSLNGGATPPPALPQPPAPTVTQ